MCTTINLIKRRLSVKKSRSGLSKKIVRDATIPTTKKHRDDKKKHYQSLLLSINDGGVSVKPHRGLFISVSVAESSFPVTGRSKVV